MAETIEKQNVRVDGVFDVWDVADNYARISEKYARGTIKGEVRVKNKSIDSMAYFTSNTKLHTGLEITLQNQRGETTVYIAQEEIPPLSELVAMENSSVEFESRTWSSAMEGTSVTAKLKFLDGKLAGRMYQGREFA